MKYALTLQYSGENYSGYQSQKNENSIQTEVEKAIGVILREEVRIHSAGRTDQGVHAVGLVVHFETQHNNLDLHGFIYSVNAILPGDISIIHGAVVPSSFHARFSCIAREYVYKVIVMPYRPSIEKNAYWIREELDIASIRQAASRLIGEKDFTSFTKTNSLRSGKSAIRRIDRIELIQKGSLFFFYYKGSGFLHNMIRILTGTLLAVSMGKIKPADVGNILRQKNRRLAAKTLPPYALYFLNAVYEDYETPRALIRFD